MLQRTSADAFRTTRNELATAEVDPLGLDERERLIAEARAAARNIVAEAERAAQDIVARAIKIRGEADRMVDDAKSKATRIEKRAQGALALAENIAECRRLMLALSDQSLFCGGIWDRPNVKEQSALWVWALN